MMGGLDPFERLLVVTTETFVQKGFLWILILKTLKNRPTYGYDLRKIISKKFAIPHQATLYSTLKMMRLMGLIKPEKRGRCKFYHVTPKGEKILIRATRHLKSLTRKATLFSST